ncbi:hypothetical protein Tsubulata_019780 [Turnera subulata]|uniref:Fe2OG dioxygenase domain-containing protein n=1 Tax=Turnera subulata TaxID=218843 RepID=A0A9Q0EZU0_9ROSI|nr:hypothetical protein Tsubulata_019780 [Turnera subulata]
MAGREAAVLVQEPITPSDSNPHHLIPNTNPLESIVAVDEEIPIIDYAKLFSDDLDERSTALQHLSKACEEYGFFNLVNHPVPDNVIECTLKKIADHFRETEAEEKQKYLKKSSQDTVVFGLNSYACENREFAKMVVHPENHCPPDHCYREALEEYMKGMEEVKLGLARAISKILGQEETYIEDVFDLKRGFDVASLNVYPPCFNSKSFMGLPTHTDPGFCVSLVQDVNGGLRILTHQGKWISVSIPPSAILIQLGDHLEVLTNGKFKSHLHYVMVAKNKVQRISLATLHGPSLDTFVSPAPEFVDEHRPPAYRAMTYRQALETNGNDPIDMTTALEHLRLCEGV